MAVPFRKRTVAAVAIAVAVTGAPVGWMVSDRMERDNDFCTSCHLSPGVPLHIDIRRAFDATEPTTLAAVHAVARVESRGIGPAAAFRCIDCHGGTSAIGRLRVKALAAKDAFWYLLGRFEEPTRMNTPLWDEDCTKCHGDFDEREVEAFESPRFHQLAVHNVELGVACVECHQVHTSGGDSDAYFIRAGWVREKCAICHPRFE